MRGKQSVQELMVFKGIEEAKAIAIVPPWNWVDVGVPKRRRCYIKSLPVPRCPTAATLLGELPMKNFGIVYLNNSNRILQTVQLSKGGITGTVVDIRLAFKQALQLGAVAIILAHNHPSGTLKPSHADIQLTKIKACRRAWT